MNQRGVSYVSRLKLNNRIYQKNPDPTHFQDGSLKKQTEYLPLDLEYIMNRMQTGEIMEIRDAYIRRDQKLPARVYHLPMFKYKKDAKTKPIKRRNGVKVSEKSKRLTRMNVYITNIAWEIVPKERVHDLYSLSWQVEIVFKTWNLFFKSIDARM